MNKTIGISILLIGIIVSISAAWYSIIGLSQLFSGAAIPVMIMASSLEISKIMIATALKLYWNDIKIQLKSYLVISVLVLMMITSVGIYGFLSAAYRNVFELNQVIENKIQLLDTKKSFYVDNIKYLDNEKLTLLNNSKKLTDSYASVNQTVDKRTGQLIITTNSKSQGKIDNRINSINSAIADINVKIFNYTDSINKIEDDKLVLKNNAAIAELGPLKYISKITGIDMDNIVNYLILTIIFVFDPLAIALLLLGISVILIPIIKHSKKEVETTPDNIIPEVEDINDFIETPTYEHYKSSEDDNIIIPESDEINTSESELHDIIDQTFNDPKLGSKHNFNKRIETQKKS